jgi:hypothetical protein
LKEKNALGRTQKSYHTERKKGNINKDQIIKSNNNEIIEIEEKSKLQELENKLYDEKDLNNELIEDIQ